MTRSESSMSNADFVRYAATYGSQLEHWPRELQVQARRCLEQSPELLNSLRAEESLDAWLESLQPSPPPSAELYRRLVADLAGTQPRQRSHDWRELWQWLGGWRLLAPSLATGLVLGLALSSVDPAGLAPSDEVDLLEAGLIDLAYEEYPP